MKQELNLPDPLVPAEVDLTGFTFMPVRLRILTSDLFVKSTGEEFKAAFALWCRSWHERPAASLPDDPVMLAFFACVDAETWARVSTRALHGWSRRSDGRLHHETLAPLALEAWEKRDEFRQEKENRETRQKRWRDKLKRLSGLLRDFGKQPPRGASLEKLTEMCAEFIPGFSVSNVDGEGVYRVDGAEIGKTGIGRGTGIETGIGRGTGIGIEGVGERGGAEKPTKPAAKAPRKRAAHTTADAADKGSRLSKDWVLPQSWGLWALEKFPHWTPDQIRSIAESFRDHFSALPVGRDALKSDWLATWRNWCKSGITQRDYPPPKKLNGHGAKPHQVVDVAARNAELAKMFPDADFGGQAGLQLEAIHHA
jgi:hypothetical protein